jgi:hypothetical protein
MVGVLIPYMPLLKVLEHVHMYEQVYATLLFKLILICVCLNKKKSLFLVVGFSLFHALLPLCVRSEISITFLLGPFSILIRFT